MRILIDTNILIHLEDNKVVKESFAKFYQLAVANKCEVLYHPACLEDLGRDKNEDRKKITLSKLRKYVYLSEPAVITEEFKSLIGQKSTNDEIDNVQLYQVFKKYVELLVTEDKGIKEKARKINLSDTVLSIDEALKLLKDKYTLIIPQHPILEECSTRKIESQINESFFDSLRESYTGFNDWFLQKCCIENRRCYLLKVEGTITAILIYHIEKPNEHLLADVHTEAMKMCTFKVDETVFGYRLGELFLNKMFQMCVEHQILCLYLTVFPHHTHLIALLEKYGFRRHHFTNKHGEEELRMIKSMRKGDYSRLENVPGSHPFFHDGEQVNKFVVPISPDYYRTLFKDGGLRQRTLFDDTMDSLNEIEGNTISKAYLCKSKRLAMKSGDILLFYSSRTARCIEPIGVLDRVYYSSDSEAILKLVKRKTVYSEEQISEMVKSGRDTTVLIFRLVYYLQTPFSMREIKQLESYGNNFQTITTLTENDYQILKSKNLFNERYIIN